MFPSRALLLGLAAATLLAPRARAATLTVGPDGQYKLPSQAIAAAHDGDTVQIAPGQYFDCAVVRANGLTLEGAGTGAVMTDKVCQGKAILVVSGNDTTIRNMTFQRARVPDRNGAGIRAQGGSITIENSHFLNNENGILAAASPRAVYRIVNSEFVGNGKCDGACSHGIYVNGAALLHIEHSRFFDQHVGHHIKSRAARTELIDDTIEDGPEGDSSYLVDIPSGGSLVIQGSLLEKGPHSSNPSIAITIGEEGVSQPTEQILIERNTFINDQSRPCTFVRNVTATPAELIGNTFKGHETRPLDGDGKVR